MRKLLKKVLDREFLRFCMVGVVNTLVGAGVMFGLYNLAGCSYWVSSAMNYIVGGVVSYFLNKHFTFRVRGGGAAQMLRFAANVAVCYVLAYSLAQPLVMSLLNNTSASISLRDNVAMLAGMGIYTVLNYLGQRFFAFRSRENKEKSE